MQETEIDLQEPAPDDEIIVETQEIILRFSFHELILLLCSGVAVLLSIIFGLRFYFPSLFAGLFIIKHYIGPSMLLIIIPFMLGLARGIIYPSTRGHFIRPKSRISMVRLNISFLLIVWLHFNFKWWAPLINGNLYDRQYNAMDNFLSPILVLINGIHQVCWFDKIAVFQNAYHGLFVLMFFVSLFVAALKKDASISIQLITALALVLGLGGLCYSLFPALGPFIFSPSPHCLTRKIQTSMLTVSQLFIQSGGLQYSGDYFVSPLAAMPSLHISHALVFSYYAIARMKIISIPMVLITFYIFVDSIALRWHYLIDLPAGMALAIVAILLSNRFGIDKYEVCLSPFKFRHILGSRLQ
jgi:hypothetical protein